jgi:hypothetical protein
VEQPKDYISFQMKVLKIGNIFIGFGSNFKIKLGPGPNMAAQDAEKSLHSFKFRYI